jgi:cytochrome c-type biogenesis protein CcmH
VRRSVLLVLALVLAFAASAPAVHAGQAPRASITDIEDEVMCVACGVPLDIADSPQATSERSYIRELVAQGKTKDQIKTELVSQFGPRVLALPKDKGFGLVAYLVPIAIVVLMLIGLAIFLPRWRRNRTDGSLAVAGPDLSDADARRLDEDLARYDV